MAPLCYDPDSLDELEVALPSSPLITLSSNAYLQPPLTRRGTGPGMIAFLPPSSAYKPNIENTLDPEPVQKWAEEGFAVVGVTSGEGWSIEEALTKGVEALLSLEELDTRDKFAVYGEFLHTISLYALCYIPCIVYDPNAVTEVLFQMQQVNDTRLSCIVAIGNPEKLPPVPTYLHLPPTADYPQIANTISHRFTKSPYFLLPQSAEYVPGEATLAHSRVLEFLRKILGGPIFDIEAIWEEHTYFEFEVRSVAKTMGTMVVR